LKIVERVKGIEPSLSAWEAVNEGSSERDADAASGIPSGND